MEHMNYKDFINEENGFHGVTELAFVMSNDMVKLLEGIPHEISEELLKLNTFREDSKVTMVGLSDTDFTKFTLVNSNKAYDNVLNYYAFLEKEPDKEDIIKRAFSNMKPNTELTKKEMWVKNRVTIRIGAFIKKIFPGKFKQGGEPGQDIESFVHAVVARRESGKKNVKDRFKLVYGDDIVKYYNVDNSDIMDSQGNRIEGTLGKSCMRYYDCGNYVQFYANNKDVGLLVLFSDVDGREEQIVGRALIWELETPKDRIFMDRVYYNDEGVLALFIDYANAEGYLYKNKQNSSSDFTLMDPVNNTSNRNVKLTTVNTFEPHEYYPYVDTLKWYNRTDKYLTNDHHIEDSPGDVIFLESEDGGFAGGVDNGKEFSDYYNEWVDVDELIYCAYGDDKRKEDDTYYVKRTKNYATREYVDQYMSWSNYNDEWIMDDDSMYSEFHGTNIHDDDAIDMYDIVEDVEASDDIDDVFIKDEDDGIRHKDEIGISVIEYKAKDDWEYHFDKKKYEDQFILVKTSHYPDEKIEYKHRILDSDKLYKWEDKWYYRFDIKSKDKVIGQKRLWDN